MDSDLKISAYILVLTIQNGLEMQLQRAPAVPDAKANRAKLSS
jgi:hypothetical protein